MDCKSKNSIYLHRDASVLLAVVSVAVVDVLATVAVVAGCIDVDVVVTGLVLFGSVVICDPVGFRGIVADAIAVGVINSDVLLLGNKVNNAVV